MFSKVFSYFPLIYVPLENISARPPIYVLFSKYEDSFVFQDVELSLGGKSSGGVVLWDMGGMMRCGDVRMVKVGVRRGQNIIRGVRG